MISSLVSRVSAAVLGIGGLALLFAPDVILTRLVPGFPPEAAWVGQLIAAAWIALAALNWLSRGAMLGGIYGRPVVFANSVLYFVTALSVMDAASHGHASLLAWGIAAIAGAMALTYGTLLFRGPLESELRAARG